MSKKDMTPRDSNLDARIMNCILLSATVPKLKLAGEVWQENAKMVKPLETVHITVAEKIFGSSKTTSNK